MKKLRLRESTIGFLVIGIICIIVIPLPPALLDFMLIVNIALGLTVLLTALYIKEPLQFSSFPTLLLIATLFRLALNISSTRLILSNGGEAGQVIKAFGTFVVRGNVVVGLIIFLIIVVIQFIVITKGSERVSEVSARFTLDSMPGKQMAIDADLNAGLIDEQQARARRSKVENEANFYGAMDGASKFVKGDAIAGIVITLINLIGGAIVGMLSGKMDLGKVMEVYSLATVGDGLSSQIPALLISTAAGIVTTRSASEDGLNRDMARQLFSQSTVMMTGGASLILLSLVPGFPKLTLIAIGASMLLLGYRMSAPPVPAAQAAERVAASEAPEPAPRPASVTELLHVDPIALEFGYSLIPLVDEQRGGDLLGRMAMIRQQCAVELGIVIPVVRFRDNLSLRPDEYVIKMSGIEVERGEVLADRLLAMNAMDAQGEDVEGIETRDPAFGMPAKWIRAEDRDRAEMIGYTVIVPSSVIATHLTEVIKRHSHELLGRQEVKTLLDTLKEKAPVLVDEVVPGVVSIGKVQKVLAGLLREGIPVRNLAAILEALGDYGKIIRDEKLLIEAVRQSLRREITSRFAKDGRIDVVTVPPDIEEQILSGVRKTDAGNYLSLDPESIRRIMTRMNEELRKAADLGIEPVIISSPGVRMYLKEISARIRPDIDVLSYNDLENTVSIQVVGSL
ncbi:MAG: flagellar biosynthesis protein FlhA [Clostridiales bacterium]|nr:flagellar biosynthesis protein FlhA [Clostridiales bacterium]